MPTDPMAAGEANEPAVDPLGACRIYGRFRQGASAMAVGALQGVAVSPDGDTVGFR